MGNSMTVQKAEPPEASVLNMQMKFAKAIADSDIIPDAYRGKPSNVLVAVQFGQSMGISMAESLYRINVIKGKPSMSGELIASQVRKAGHKLRIRTDEKNMSVTATICRADDPDYEFKETRNMAWAKRMGLDGRENYRKQPLTMLMWRAVSAVAREACPEALYGAGYVPEELESDDDDNIEYSVEEEHPIADEQRKQVHDLLVSGGVKDDRESGIVLSELLGRDGANESNLTINEVEDLLDSEDMTVNRVTNALAHLDKHEADDTTPQKSATLADVKQGFANIGCSMKDAQPAIEKIVNRKVDDPRSLTPAELDRILEDLNHSEVKNA